MSVQRSWHRVLWLSTFAVAMGFLEAAVVVYLSELYSPHEFPFPIVQAPARIIAVEMIREATTLIMLVAAAILAGRAALDRFYVFAYLFGVWDIFYYVGLRVFLGWPASLFTWDILFLIPVPWVAPVLYPILVSLSLITGFLVHEILRAKGRLLTLSRWEWVAASFGGVLIIVSFCWHWRVVAEERVPSGFPYWLFVTGLLGGILPFVRAGLRASRHGPLKT